MYEKLVADVEYLRGNYSVAAEMYHEGARDGDPLAAFNYGYCLWRGLGVQYDPAEAKSFFSYARELPGGESCYNLAVMYMHGEGVKRDYKKCAEFMRISATLGCIEAQLYMGMAYTSGCIFEPDVIGISMIPYHKAEYRDSVLMLEGEIENFELDEDLRYNAVKQNPNLAFEYFKTAARHDPTYVEELTAKGKYLYARCFVDGLGTDFDREKSTRLMHAASKSGSAEATSYLMENGLASLLQGGDIKKFLAGAYGEKR